QAENYRVYKKGVFPLFKKYGASLITFDDNPETFEGESPRADRMIIVQFPSEKHARDWYADPDYQSLSEHRRAGTTLEFLTMVRGLPPR
ncbi:MAG: DUF1330 domain-containing protein, partial [Pseudomonadota bacterium]